MAPRRTAAMLVGTAVLAAACGGGDGGSASGFCDQAAAVQERFDELEDAGPGNFDAFGEVHSALADLDPPAEIADDFDALVDAIGRMAEVFEDFDPESSDLGDLTALQEDLAALEASGERVDTYLRDECGLDVDG